MPQRGRRWIVLSEDGRHSTVGRHTDPAELLASVGKQLRGQGIGGWLAVLESDYHQPRSKLSLMMVRELAPSASTWLEAEGAFRRIRDQLA